MSKVISTWHINKLRSIAREAFMLTSKVKHENVLIVSANEEVPVKSGRLGKSAKVKLSRLSTNHITYKSSFGSETGIDQDSSFASAINSAIDATGPSVKPAPVGKFAYAIHWHNNPANFKHGRKMHYLIDPFMREFSGDRINDYARTLAMLL